MSDDYHLKVCHCELSTVFLIGAIAAIVGKVTHFIHFDASLPIFAMRYVNKMYPFYFGPFPQPGWPQSRPPSVPFWFVPQEFHSQAGLAREMGGGEGLGSKRLVRVPLFWRTLHLLNFRVRRLQQFLGLASSGGSPFQSSLPTSASMSNHPPIIPNDDC